MPKKILINSPIINELVFDYLYNLTPAQKQKFSLKELRAIKSAKKARAFVDRSTLDEKLLLLAKLGVGFSFILHDTNTLMTKREIKARYEKYTNMSAVENLQSMSDEKFVVLTDRILINYLNLMGNQTHSDVYMLNLDFHKVGESINAWKKEKPSVNSLRKSLEYAIVINRLLLHSAIEHKKIRGVNESSDIDLMLLMYFYSKQNGYVLRETIKQDFDGYYKMTKIGACLKRLRDELLIDRNPVHVNNEEYQITGLGIDKVMSFLKKIINKSI
jgi:hypothetical protein